MKNWVMGVLILTLSFCASSKDDARLISPAKIAGPGKTTRFGVVGIKATQLNNGKPQAVPFVVYQPTNYTTDKKWPVIMEWHGAGGRAGVPISKQVTGGKDFICVGLTYISMKAKDEHQYINIAYSTVMEKFNGNKKAVFPGGFSAGGLAQERFILTSESISKYCAVWMFGAGLVRPDKKTIG